MNTKGMLNHTEITGFFAAAGFYTISKILGYATPAVTALRDTWHFQMLQEMALAATIISAGVAVFTFIRNSRKDNKKSNKNR